jgi:hypothetical protein
MHFFDPDDFILPTFYETMLHAGYLQNADVVMSCHWVVEPHTPAWDTSNLREAHLPASLRFGPNPTTAKESPAVFLAHTPVWDKLFSRNFLINNDINSISLNAEDIPFTWMAYCLASKISTVSKNEYFYRNRPGSITGKYGIFKDVYETVHITEQWLRENNFLQQYRPFWYLKKFVSCAYGMYKIPHYLFTHPRDGHEFCTNLANLIKGIDPADLSPFANHALYRNWVECFHKLREGNVFSNIVHEISKCTSVPVPDFHYIAQEHLMGSAKQPDSFTIETNQATNGFDSNHHQQSKMDLLRKRHRDKIKNIRTILN